MGGTWGDGPERGWLTAALVILVSVALWYVIIHVALWVGRLIAG
jgi:hypothetical protein